MDIVKTVGDWCNTAGAIYYIYVLIIYILYITDNILCGWGCLWNILVVM